MPRMGTAQRTPQQRTRPAIDVKVLARKSRGNGRPKPSARSERADRATSTQQHAAESTSKPKSPAISAETRRLLYGAADYLTGKAESELGLQIPFEVFVQDPQVSKANPDLAKEESFSVRWEPGLTDGPTSARFAVVDFNGDSGQFAPAAKWHEKLQRFVSGQTVLEKDAGNLQFHQVNVWAMLQRALVVFEGGNGLGRPIPWAFEGNRLLVVPHAGYGENAFYDRRSKSLQFYYFESETDTVYTCLSSDIVNHEFGHAVLDGIRPYYMDGGASVQTAAFHEFFGDLTAILITLKHGPFRNWLARKTGGDMSKADELSSIAEEFGSAVKARPYLRSAIDRDTTKETMSSVADSRSPHPISQVLTKAMFDILLGFTRHYAEARGLGTSSAFADVAGRMEHIAIQPLDLLPPVDVTFRDYALAVVRAEELSNPLDPYNYRDLLIRAFREREILTPDNVQQLAESHYLHERRELLVYHDIDKLSRSRSAAYRFLDDNRDELLIPALQDIVVADLYEANKLSREGDRMPRQVILEYVWREEVPLVGARFGAFNGRSATMLCGGTLVFDETGTWLSWMRKPGTVGRTLRHGKRRGTSLDREWAAEVQAGVKRRDDLLRSLAQHSASGKVGAAAGSEQGLLETRLPPITAEIDHGTLRLELSPHMSLSDEDEGTGGPP